MIFFHERKDVKNFASVHEDLALHCITLEIPTLESPWLSLRKFCYVNMRNINVNKVVSV